jgi:hypothetical protein
MPQIVLKNLFLDVKKGLHAYYTYIDATIILFLQYKSRSCLFESKLIKIKVHITFIFISFK